MMLNMITDITLKSKDGRVLILDAQYYGQQMQSNFDVQTYRNGNLYQIFTYVKNWDKDQTGNVAGMLLYAKTRVPKMNGFLREYTKVSQ